MSVSSARGMQRLRESRLANLPVRTVELTRLLDTLLICSVATILVIRTQLWLTNYPQLGGSGLHIAHLLWGGLFMLIALVLLVSFLSPMVRRVGAFVGGIGFGFFIDELGKFVTEDNNYFFKPTAAIIYILFVIFYLAIRRLERGGALSPREALVNALELVKDAAMQDMDEQEKRRALELLDRADQKDPLVEPVRGLIEKAASRAPRRQSVVARAGNRLRDGYLRLVKTRWFTRALTVFFIAWAVVSVVQVVGLVFGVGEDVRANDPLELTDKIFGAADDVSFISWAKLVSSLVAGGLVLAGVVRLRRSRIAAYRMFERALLVSIFITQFFAFVQSQFAAVFGLFLNVFLFFTLRYMLDREVDMAAQRSERSPKRAGPELPAGAPA